MQSSDCHCLGSPGGRAASSVSGSQPLDRFPLLASWPANTRASRSPACGVAPSAFPAWHSDSLRPTSFRDLAISDSGSIWSWISGRQNDALRVKLFKDDIVENDQESSLRCLQQKCSLALGHTECAFKTCQEGRCTKWQRYSWIPPRSWSLS